jgi:hypothetical protein
MTFLSSSFLDKIDCIGKVHNYGKRKENGWIIFYSKEYVDGNDNEHNADLNNE